MGMGNQGMGSQGMGSQGMSSLGMGPSQGMGTRPVGGLPTVGHAAAMPSPPMPDMDYMPP